MAGGAEVVPALAANWQLAARLSGCGANSCTLPTVAPPAYEYRDPPTSLLQLDYRPDLDILVGRWGYQPAPDELPAVYQRVEAEALRTQCRFWLQDIRRRTLNDPQTTSWLLSTFFPGMARRLGGRLFIAYLVGPTLHAVHRQSAGLRAGQAYHNKPFATSFFGDEGAAISWLQMQQADKAVLQPG